MVIQEKCISIQSRVVTQKILVKWDTKSLAFTTEIGKTKLIFQDCTLQYRTHDVSPFFNTWKDYKGNFYTATYTQNTVSTPQNNSCT